LVLFGIFIQKVHLLYFVWVQCMYANEQNLSGKSAQTGRLATAIFCIQKKKWIKMFASVKEIYGCVKGDSTIYGAARIYFSFLNVFKRVEMF
jgi:hypothetical protein